MGHGSGIVVLGVVEGDRGGEAYRPCEPGLEALQRRVSGEFFVGRKGRHERKMAAGRVPRRHYAGRVDAEFFGVFCEKASGILAVGDAVAHVGLALLREGVGNCGNCDAHFAEPSGPCAAYMVPVPAVPSAAVYIHEDGRPVLIEVFFRQNQIHRELPPAGFFVNDIAAHIEALIKAVGARRDFTLFFGVLSGVGTGAERRGEGRQQHGGGKGQNFTVQHGCETLGRAPEI